MRRIGVAALWAACCILLTLPVAAQDNLLTNGGLEEGEFGPYTGRGRADLNVPAGWNIWLGQGPQDQFLNRGDKTFSFPHNGPDPAPVEGNTAANLSGGFVQFNAAYFQQVNGVGEGTNLRAEAASQVKACDLNGASNCGSSPVSGARTRIGIDPDGGDNPNAPEIVWSSWVEPHDQWLRQSVEATTTGDSVTVFLYATQDQPAELNRAYWDDASLTATGDGGSADENTDGESADDSPPPTVQQFVPFVNAQGAQEDGSIVHTVTEGDTLLSIAVAYDVPATRITELNPELGDARSLRVGQRLLIEPADTSQPTATPERAAAPTDIPGGTAPDADTVEVEEAAPPGDNGADDETDGGDVDTSAVIGEFAGLLQTNTPASKATAESTTKPTRASNSANAADDGTDEPTPDETQTQAAIATSTPQPDTADDQTAAPTVAEPTAPPQVDFTASTASVCVSLFDDVNENRLQEQGEDLLAGGQIVLNDTEGDPAAEYATDGQSEPHCFSELNPGEYIAVVTPPQGYGLTTPNRLRLPLTSGTSLNIEFGAAEGVEVAAADGLDSDTDASASTTTEDTPAAADTSSGPLMDFITENIVLVSGVLVAALLAIVLVAGIGAAILLRRAN